MPPTAPALRATIERWRLVEASIIAVLVVFYLLPDPRLSRNLYYLAVLPLAALAARRERAAALLRSPLFVAIAAYLTIILAASVIAADAKGVLLLDRARDSLLILTFVAIVADRFGGDERFAAYLFLVLGLAAALMAVANFAQSPSWPGPWLDGSWRLRAVEGLTPALGQNELSALYTAAGVGTAAAASQRRLPTAGRLLCGLAGGILLAAVILAQSRGALLSFGAGLTVILLAGLPPRIRLVAVVATAALIAAAILFTPLPAALVERGDAWRLLIWRTYLTGFIADAPWLGHGISTLQIVTLPTGETHAHAHDIVLSAWVRGGALAALALLTALLLALDAAWRAWRRLGLLLPAATMTAAVTATTVDYGLDATSVGYQWVIVWLPLALCLGAELRLAPSAPRPGRT